MPIALDFARGAAFSRAFEVVFSPELFGTAKFADIHKPKCVRLTAKRVGCSYRFTVHDADDVVLHEEAGRVRVVRKRGRVTTRVVRPVRDGYQSSLAKLSG